MNEPAEVLLGKAINYQGDKSFPLRLYYWLKAIVPIDNITMLAYFSARSPEMLFAQANQETVHENFERVYMAGAYLLDPFHDLHVTKAPAGVYRLNDIAPDQFQRNRYFQDYYSKTSLIDELAFVGYPSKGTSVHVCLGRDGSSNTRFTTRETAAARQVSPIVEALIGQQWGALEDYETVSETDVITRLIAATKTEHDVSLSPRQAQVALLILRGHSSVSIGLKLGISPQTVKVFRKQLFRKCSISSQAELFNMMLPLLGA